MKITKRLLYIILVFNLLITLNACKKSNFLDKKPSTNILQPTTLNDFQNLLENTTVMNYTGGLAQLASDDYTVSYMGWQTVSATQRNSYIWDKNIFGGDVEIRDWNILYQQIFYANSVLDGLSKSDSSITTAAQNITGWALFTRAFAFYDLTRTFCKAYDSSTASSDLGIPLRLASAIDYTLPRSTLQQSFDQIIADLETAASLLSSNRPSNNLNRPSQVAVYALMARIYLDMRDYTLAENYADKCLGLYSTLIDYKSVSTTSATPFSSTNDELIYNARQIAVYFELTGTSTSTYSRIDQAIIDSYSPNDLRLPIYFSKLPDGTYTKKRGYNGSGNYTFTGLATDEVYLIKAECLARGGQTTRAMDRLNQLLIKRWDPDATVPAIPFQNMMASSANEALTKVLAERRKELIWRGLRWSDLKRLNKEGANITLSRVLNNSTYNLIPNDPRYVFPIPNDEIVLSGIQQNER